MSHSAHPERATIISRCRICDAPNLLSIIDLGSQPLANGLLKSVTEHVDRYPLEIMRCGDCGLVQLHHVVHPTVLFSEYPYMPSLSSTYLDHFEEIATECIERFHITDTSLVMDIGCNDGSLLHAFARRGIPVLGIDPAHNIVPLATKKGIRVLEQYFDETMAKDMRKESIQADLILTTNVLAHIPDLHGFISGIESILSDTGVFVAQFSYLGDLIDRAEFDTVYHEHCSYFSLKPLRKLFEGSPLHIFDVRRTEIHGGSLRIFVGQRNKYQEKPSVQELLHWEEQHNLYQQKTYDDFATAVTNRISVLRETVLSLKRQGKRIVGYGMPAKATVLLNACGLDASHLDYIVDGTPFKQHTFVPVSGVPVLPEEHFVNDNPDYAVIFAWNFAEEIMKKNIAYVQRGGAFIHPMHPVTPRSPLPVPA